MKNKSIILLVFAYALSQGVQEALLPVLNLDFEPLGIEEVMILEITWLRFQETWYPNACSQQSGCQIS